MEYISIIIAQAATPATQAAEGAPQGGGSQMLIFLVLMFAAMYFLMFAPQRKKQKAHAKMISELKSGDRIVANIKDKTFVVKFGDNSKVEFLKSAIQDKVPEDAPKAENK